MCGNGAGAKPVTHAFPVFVRIRLTGSFWNICGQPSQIGHLALTKSGPFGLALEFEFADKITGPAERAIYPQTWRDCAGPQPVAHPYPAFVGVGPNWTRRNVGWHRSLLGKLALTKLPPAGPAFEVET